MMTWRALSISPYKEVRTIIGHLIKREGTLVVIQVGRCSLTLSNPSRNRLELGACN